MAHPAKILLILLLLGIRAFGATGCVESVEDAKKMVNPIRIIGVTYPRLGVAKFIYAIEQIPGRVNPRNIGIVLTPDLENSIILPNTKDLAVVGNAIAYAAPLGSSSGIPKDYDDEGRQEAYRITQEIHIPQNRIYFAYAAGYVCEAAAESYRNIESGNGEVYRRVKWTLAMGGKDHIPLTIASGSRDQVIQFDAIDIYDGVNSLRPMGTLVKVYAPKLPIAKVRVMKLAWGDGESQSLTNWVPAFSNYAGVNSLVPLTAQHAYVTPANDAEGFMAVAWLPRASDESSAPFRLKATIKLEDQDNQGAPGDGAEIVNGILERNTTSRGNASAVSVIRRIRDLPLTPRASMDVLVPFAAYYWTQGVLARAGKYIVDNFASEDWFKSRRAPTLDEMTRVNGSWEEILAGHEVTVDPKTEANAFLDGYSRISFHSLLVGTSSAAGEEMFYSLHAFRIKASEDISLHQKVSTLEGIAFAELPVTRCKDDLVSSCLYLSGTQLKEVLNEGLWVRNERLADRLQNLHVNGAERFLLDSRLDEFGSFRGGYKLSIEEIDPITGEGDPNSPYRFEFLGYADLRPIVSKSIITLDAYQDGGWYNKKVFQGYEWFDKIILPSKNPTRLRYAASPETHEAEISESAWLMDSDAPVQKWGITIGQNISDPRGGIRKPEQPVNEFDVTPRSLDPRVQPPTEGYMQNAGLHVRALTFKTGGSPNEVVVPFKFYPNNRIYTLYYGGAADEKMRNQRFAYKVAAYLGALHNIYVEVVDATALNLEGNFPNTSRTEYYRKFIESAFTWNNGVPALINYQTVNQGQVQATGGIGFVYNYPDGDIYHHGYVFLQDQEEKFWEARPSDDRTYTSAWDRVFDELLDTHYQQHVGKLLERDFMTKGIGLRYAYSRPMRFIIKGVELIPDVIDGVGVIMWGSKGLRAGGRGLATLSKLAVGGGSREVIETGGQESFKLFKVVKEGTAEISEELPTKIDGTEQYYTSFHDAHKLAQTKPGHVVQEYEANMSMVLDFDKRAEDLGCVATIDNRTLPAKVWPISGRGPPTEMALEDAFVEGFTPEHFKSIKSPLLRPGIRQYLHPEYIHQFRRHFKSGGAWFLNKKWIPGAGGTYGAPADLANGYHAGTYMTSLDEIRDLVRRANGDWSIIEDALGIPRGRWSEAADQMRIAVLEGDPYAHGFDIPDGRCAGTDEAKWIPGGGTSGGMHELSGPPIPEEFVKTYSLAEFLAKWP